MKKLKKLFFISITLILPLLISCVKSSTVKKTLSCESQKDCPNGFTCSEQGLCLCDDSKSCGDEKFCNAKGFCQASPGCSNNSTCAKDQFCDSNSGKCLLKKTGSSETCTKDIHCPFNYICNDLKKFCEEGCKNSDHCELGSVCKNNSCEKSNNEICERDADCKYSHNCKDGKCQLDVRGPFCRPCHGIEEDSCEKPMHHCLVSDEGYFCGVNCSRGQKCPNGFRCSPIVILTQRRCDFSYMENCPAGKECCPVGRECRIREGQKKGYCTCKISENCPKDKCLDGTCRITGYKCQDDGDCIIPCRNNGCFVGHNCAPIEGLLCQDTLKSK